MTDKARKKSKATSRTLVDTSTGDTHVQVSTDEATAAVTLHGHPLLEQLAGKSWVTFVEKFVVIADDDPTAVALDCQHLEVPGGTELEVCHDELARILYGAEHDDPLDSLYVPVTIRDPYFPMVTGVARLRDLRASANLVPQGRSPRGNDKPVLCDHPLPRKGCPSCFKRWWEGKAAALSAQGKGK